MSLVKVALLLGSSLRNNWPTQSVSFSQQEANNDSGTFKHIYTLTDTYINAYSLAEYTRRLRSNVQRIIHAIPIHESSLSFSKKQVFTGSNLTVTFSDIMHYIAVNQIILTIYRIGCSNCAKTNETVLKEERLRAPSTVG